MSAVFWFCPRLRILCRIRLRCTICLRCIRLNCTLCLRASVSTGGFLSAPHFLDLLCSVHLPCCLLRSPLPVTDFPPLHFRPLSALSAYAVTKDASPATVENTMQNAKKSAHMFSNDSFSSFSQLFLSFFVCKINCNVYESSLLPPLSGKTL